MQTHAVLAPTLFRSISLAKYAMYPHFLIVCQLKKMWKCAQVQLPMMTRMETPILVINEALCMGGRMQHSLLNPYQIQAAGIILNNDPRNEDQHFGLEADKHRICFQMQGMTCLFPTCTPMQWELDNCQHIEITPDTEWDPNDAHFGPASYGSEEGHSQSHSINTYNT